MRVLQNPQSEQRRQIDAQRARGPNDSDLAAPVAMASRDQPPEGNTQTSTPLQERSGPLIDDANSTQPTGTEDPTLDRDTRSIYLHPGDDPPHTVSADSPLPEAAIAQFKRVPDKQTRASIKDYEVLDEIGRGGMGTVWHGREKATGRHVAVKFLYAHQIDSERARARFQREVRLAARLEHPHIARVYGTGLQDGCYFYAMEYVDGVPLDQHVRRYRYSLAQTIELIQQVCEAVGYAHQQGIAHRDLKPSNILVTRNGAPILVDFGLAKRFDATADDTIAQATLSGDGHVTGSPGYMAPEQAAGRSRQVDERTDIYALGCILFKLLTGEHPHDQTGPLIDVIQRICTEPVRSPRELNPRISRDLEAILLTALAEHPDDRYPTTEAFANDLHAHLTGGKPSVGSRFLVRWRRKAIRHRGKIALGMLMFAVHITLGLGLGYVLYQDSEEEARELAARQRLEARLEALHQALRRYEVGKRDKARNALEFTEQPALIDQATRLVDTLGASEIADDLPLQTPGEESLPPKVTIPATD